MIKIGRVHAFRVSFPSFLLFLFLAKSLFALMPDRRISQLGHTAWRLQDGYFGGQPTSITQTTDGYIWVGTRAGLFRFDGVRFVPWSSLERERLPSNLITSLLAARDGSLWIGTDAGLAHWVNRHLRTYLQGALIPPMVEDETGRIWVAPNRAGDYTHGLCEVVDTAARCYGSEDGVPPATGPGPVVRDLSGNIWAGGSTTILRWQPESSYAYRPKALKGNEPLDGVEALSVAPDGSLWVGIGPTGPGLGLQHMVNGNLKSFVAPKLNGETLQVLSLLNDRDNSLWVGSGNQGIYRIHGTDIDHYGSTDGLSSDSVFGFFQDHEGNLWVATSQGIDMFRDLRVSSFSKREGLSVDNVDSILASRDGTIWIGTSTNLEVLGPNGFSSYPRNVPQGHQITSLLEDHAGGLWVGIGSTLSIYQGGRLIQIKKKDGKPVGPIAALTEDSEHNIWAERYGPPGTLFRIQDLKVREEFTAPAMPLARKIVADPQSGIWLGLVNGDLARYRSGKIEIFPFGKHPTSRVNAIIAASDGSILGATSFGIVGWKSGKQQILDARNGLPCDSFTSLISDNQGDLWLYGQCGLIEIARDELQRWWEHPESRLMSRAFDAPDGVQPGLAHFNTSAMTPDGRLWFANGSVVQMIDPGRIAANAVAPAVHVETIIADRKIYSPQEGLRLPALTRNLEIDYTALSFVVPRKVFFRYMLEGHDASWQEPGTRRQAFYNDLRPGHYGFRVIACNNDGVWNEEGATLNFSVPPAWFQTNWFRILCAVSGAFVVWTLYRRRVRQFEIALSTRERLRQAQADLAHINRVSTMGELTASLAHEIRQPISAAVTDSKTCLRWLGRDQPDVAEAREAASRIIQDVTRASDIIGRIGSLFRKGAPQRESLDVNEVIQEMIALLRPEANRHSISIHAELANDLPQIMADRIQLQQVLMNLMLNGIDAMKDMSAPRKLTITSSRRHEDHRYLLVSVADTGVGVQPEKAEQIFDAFFTSKPQGTGMGLPISRSIIESHGGRLWATSNVGPGAMFQFTLPTEDTAHQTAPPQHAC
jgi:signal transduction histidine kinase/ligand-binding sensor domain-containing protein